MRYTLPRIPPSNNRYIGRSARWEYQREKKEWARLIAVLCQPRPKEPLEQASVKISYYFPTRGRRDPDNYSGKMILDGLVAAGILRDDCFACITLELCGGYDKDDPRTVVEIYTREGEPI